MSHILRFPCLISYIFIVYISLTGLRTRQSDMEGPGHRVLHRRLRRRSRCSTRRKNRGYERGCTPNFHQSRRSLSKTSRSPFSSSWAPGRVLIFASADTLIVWQEPDGKDYALSFQDLEGCSEVWDFIQEVRKHLRSLGSSVLSVSTSSHSKLNDAQMNQDRPHRTQSTPLRVAYPQANFQHLH